MAASDLETKLAQQLALLRVPAPETEFRFAAHHVGGPGKGVRERLRAARLSDWKFDFAWPAHRFAVEVEGGAWINGRHNRGAGFEEDLRKYHAAMSIGWNVYRCGASLIKTGQAAELIENLLHNLRSQKIGVGQ